MYPQSLLRTNEIVIKAVLTKLMAVFAAVLLVFIKAVILIVGIQFLIGYRVDSLIIEL